MAIGAYYAGWRPGGRIWIAPEHWGRLRRHRLRRRWTLTTPAGEVLRLERRAAGPHEIELSNQDGFLGVNAHDIVRNAITGMQ